MPWSRGEDEPAVFGAASYFDPCLAGRIFNGIVDEVAHDVAEMRAVGTYGESFRLDAEGDADGFVRLQLVLLDEGRDDLFGREGLYVQAEGFPAFHRHAEYLLYQPGRCAGSVPA